MKKIIRKLLSGVLAAVLALGVVVVPNSNSLAFTAYAAEQTLAAPKLISTKKGNTLLSLTWGKVEGANAYRVYIKKQVDEEYEKYTVTSNTSCSIKKNLKSGTAYSVKITPIFIGDDNKVMAKGKSLVVKMTTSKYDDTLKNIVYTPEKIEWADITAFGGGIYSSPSCAYFNISWDELKDDNYCKQYRVYSRIKKSSGYDYIPVDADIEHKDGRVIAKIQYSCGTKASFAICPIRNSVEGKKTIVNVTTYAPNVTSINLAKHGFTKGKNNTYYSVGKSSLPSSTLVVSAALGSYGYELTYNNKASNSKMWVYKVKYNSVSVGTLSLTKTNSGVTITLKDSGDHIMYVESPQTVQLYL